MKVKNFSQEAIPVAKAVGHGRPEGVFPRAGVLAGPDGMCIAGGEQEGKFETREDFEGRALGGKIDFRGDVPMNLSRLVCILAVLEQSRQQINHSATTEYEKGARSGNFEAKRGGEHARAEMGLSRRGGF